MTNKLERVLDSLADLNRRIDGMQRREDAARADSARAANLARQEDMFQDRIARQARFADFQARVDSVLEPYNLRAPSPIGR